MYETIYKTVSPQMWHLDRLVQLKPRSGEVLFVNRHVWYLRQCPALCTVFVTVVGHQFSFPVSVS